VFVELRDRRAGHQQDHGAAAARRRTWFHRETISLAEIAVQVFSVVLGILLALGIGNWSANRESAHKIAEAQAAIRAEIRTNRVALQQTVTYQTDLANAVTAAINSSAPPKRCTDVTSWRGMHTALLLHSAYDNAIAAGVFADMPLAEGQNIAAIYALQERYVTLSDKSLDWAVMKFMNEGEAAGCAGVLGDLSRAGHDLAEHYDAYLSPAAITDPKSPVRP
jgi:type II secretory pathway pseudopilin PulG